MNSVEVEARYVELAQHDDSSCWKELPLSELRRMFVSEAEKAFLEREIVQKQTGRAHPQDATGRDAEMRLYWVFRENSDTTRNRREVGHELSVKASVPTNAAARAAVVDGLTAAAADFGGKGKGGHVGFADPVDHGKGGGNKGKKGGGKNGTPKTPKAGIYLIQFYISYFLIAIIPCQLKRPDRFGTEPYPVHISQSLD